MNLKGYIVRRSIKKLVLDDPSANRTSTKFFPGKISCELLIKSRKAAIEFADSLLDVVRQGRQEGSIIFFTPDEVIANPQLRSDHVQFNIIKVYAVFSKNLELDIYDPEYDNPPSLASLELRAENLNTEANEYKLAGFKDIREVFLFRDRKKFYLLANDFEKAKDILQTLQ